MSISEKEFVLKHVFKYVSSMKEDEIKISDIKDYFGIPWCISIGRLEDHLGLFLHCGQKENGKEWSIEVSYDMEINAVNGKHFQKSSEDVFRSTDEKTGRGFHVFVKWNTLMNVYVIDDTLNVEIRVKIKKMIGIEKKNLRNFDESNKPFSDVALVVEDQKFFVSKLFLANQSTFFNGLLFGNFKESKQEEVTLNDIEAQDFQNFLEVLYGESAIDDDTVTGIAYLADMYDAKTVVRQCQEFMTEKLPSVEEEFVLKHVIKDISSMEDDDIKFSEVVEQFGIPWRVSIGRIQDNLGLFLYCEIKENEKEWSIDVSYEVKIYSVNGNHFSKSSQSIFRYTHVPIVSGFFEFMKWNEMMKDCVIDDTLTVVTHVKIQEMIGKKNLRTFDESNGPFSDVALVVEDQKFYVSKLFLANQSTYFNSLLLENSEESEKEKVTLHDIEPEDFQNFLEVLYGQPAINDDTVTGILCLANEYDTKTVLRQCEEFLMKESGTSLKEKLELAIQYNFDNLKNKCLLEIKTIDDIRSVLPDDLMQLDHAIMASLLQKAVSLRLQIFE